MLAPVQPHPDNEQDYVRLVLDALGGPRLSLAVAEGDTGGLLLEWLTAAPGSSAVVRGGVVAYHDDLKRHVLGIEAALIQRHGAVSGVVVEAMARGVRRLAGADIGVATTGIAGPGGATPSKPVGLTFVAAVDAERAVVREHRWQGRRESNRRASGYAALQAILELLGTEEYRTDVLE